ncbi:MAG: cellulase M related protein, partial [halophilic archaeon J07HX5]
ETLLQTDTPSGYETPGQQAWIEYVSQYADTVRTDEYGNAVAVLEGGQPTVAIGGHADEIGLIVRDIDEQGYLRVSPIGGADKTVSKGQHVVVHTADGQLPGVIGQTAIHIREDDEPTAIGDQFVDIGAEDQAAAAELVDRGDPITFTQQMADLHDGKLSARGLDNRVGIWVAAEALRRAAAADPTATVYAISTVQEEVGGRGAEMVGFDLAPDAVVAVDVNHATDTPGGAGKHTNGVELGGGPVISRGGSNHPRLGQAVRTVAEAESIDVQLQATGGRTGTDADSFFTQRGGIPSLSVGVPNRYMHTPVETIHLEDLETVAALMGAWAGRAATFEYRADL